MPPTPTELSLLLHPLVPDSIAHNQRVLSTIRSLTSLLLGISAGILGLESLSGFLYYVAGSTVVSAMIWVVLLSSSGGKSGMYFGSIDPNDGTQGAGGAWKEIWLGWGGVGGMWTEGLSGYILGWAGVGGVIR